ncbi:hypothetical protein TIFTF001_047929 [Ficus carica]|uniref:Uncharacterized protein n=1 Tax=Ficus carica TaxID=3494 RepID=A0AA88D7B1_FICCA|nr:hypothetical protein TIFTF001_047929 [Ficus carica]
MDQNGEVGRDQEVFVCREEGLESERRACWLFAEVREFEQCRRFGGRAFGASDQPLRSQAMIEDWVLDRGYFGSDQEEYALKNVCLGVDIK